MSSPTKYLRKTKSIACRHDSPQVEVEVEVTLEVSATSFVMFGKLPMELQTRVWYYVCQERRIIDIGVRTFRRNKRWMNWAFSATIQNNLKTLASPTLPPPVLQVSKAARESALLSGCYQLITIDDHQEGRHKLVTNIYINLSRDIVHLDLSAQDLIDPHSQNGIESHNSPDILYCQVPYPGIPSRFSGLLLVQSILGNDATCLNLRCFAHYLQKFGALRCMVEGGYIGSALDYKLLQWFSGSVVKLCQQRFLRRTQPGNVSWGDFFGGSCVLLSKTGHFSIIPKDTFPVQGIVVESAPRELRNEQGEKYVEEQPPKFRYDIWRRTRDNRRH